MSETMLEQGRARVPAVELSSVTLPPNERLPWPLLTGRTGATGGGVPPGSPP